MFKSALIVLFILSASTLATEASCPAEVPGDTPEAIRANGERIVCLQNELTAATRQRHLEMQLEALQKAQQDALIQQRIDSLPEVPIYTP
ncbi:MAG: hypothetical protein WBA73_21670 [Devosia sp.]